jgi:DNA processing protein
MEELEAWLTLLRAPALTASQTMALLDSTDSAAGILYASDSLWSEAQLLPRTCHYLRSPPPIPAADLRWLALPGHHLITLSSPLYPTLLREIEDAPLALFVSGNAALLASPQVAMVGSRNPTPYGREIGESFGKYLTSCGITDRHGLSSRCAEWQRRHHCGVRHWPRSGVSTQQ